MKATSRSGPRRLLARLRRLAMWGSLACSVAGCTPFREYLQNGLKVGPNYQPAPAAVAGQWIDAEDRRVLSEPVDPSHWWMVFNDPVLDDLVQLTYGQNLTLREAGSRVLARRAELGIARGELFPQVQTLSGEYQRVNLSGVAANRFGTPELHYDQFRFGFGVSWELDFWGRFRRSIESARAELDASVAHYDQALVTLIADVATEYTTIRTVQQRIEYAVENARLQRESLRIASARFKGGQASKLEANQALSDLRLTESLIPRLEIELRQANNRLCVLLGVPTEIQNLGPGPIPTAGPEIAVGIPADLLRRRPDVRRAERLAAAASARIGVAEAQLYPAVAINGSAGWAAQHFGQLFGGQAFAGQVGPTFSWDFLNYGRLLNNVYRFDADFQALVANYQNTVLQANQEVEDGLVRFLRSQERAELLRQSVDAERDAFKEALAQYEGGLVTFNWVAIVQERLVNRQEEFAQARGDIALGLIQVYRALGGGWQIRCEAVPPPAAGVMPSEEGPAPRPISADQPALPVLPPVNENDP